MAKQPPKPEEKSSRPAYNVYVVDDRGEGKDPFWTKIGAAFPHADKAGFNLVLQALPLDGRLVLREPKEAE